MTPERRHRDHPFAGPMEECWHCQRDVARCKAKRTYVEYEAAHSASLEINVRNDWGVCQFPYRCHHCGHYHLTTATKTRTLRRVRRQRQKWLREQAA